MLCGERESADTLRTQTTNDISEKSFRKLNALLEDRSSLRQRRRRARAQARTPARDVSSIGECSCRNIRGRSFDLHRRTARQRSDRLPNAPVIVSFCIVVCLFVVFRFDFRSFYENTKFPTIKLSNDNSHRARFVVRLTKAVAIVANAFDFITNFNFLYIKKAKTEHTQITTRSDRTSRAIGPALFAAIDALSSIANST